MSDGIMNAIDELIEDMRDLVSERDTLGQSAYLAEWLQDLVFLGEQASNLLRELTDSDSIRRMPKRGY